MYKRMIDLPGYNSFFLFGARSTGKSFLLKKKFPEKSKKNVWIDLLIPELELKYSHSPSDLINEFKNKIADIDYFIIDEVQKVPKLLNIVHKMIEEYNVRFILTGSSARKLKSGRANMLAGRALNFTLFPMTHIELEKDFNLDEVLNFGSLAKLYDKREIKVDRDKARFLKTYVNTYLKEEILHEQIVRNLDPFHRFIEVAAQMSGNPINYSKIAKEAKTDDKNIARYFDILVDTLIGFYIPAFHSSVRKQQLTSPKFYFFDTGVIRSISGEINKKLINSTYEYGRIFEHFIILEVVRLNSYWEKDFKFYYLRSNTGKEVDLVIERPGKKRILMEIKSGGIKSKDKLSGLFNYLNDFPDDIFLVACQNKEEIDLGGNVKALPWKKAINFIFNK